MGIIKIIGMVLVIAFVVLYLIALISKGSSVYNNKPEEKNKLEGKRVKFVKDKKDKKNAIKYSIFSILMPTIAHGIYDYCLFTEQFIFIIIFGIFLIFTYIYSVKKIKS